MPFVNGLDIHGVETEDASFHSDGKAHSPGPIDGRQSTTQQPSNGENRTVALKNLPERATHLDIVASIRGGALVDVFLRSRERMASATFADARAASDFLSYAKGRNVYILGKLVLTATSFPRFIVVYCSSLFSLRLMLHGVNDSTMSRRIWRLSLSMERPAISSSAVSTRT